MKKVIIIGATSGIGKELALCYLRAGHKVGITGRRNELLQQLQQQYPSQIEIECFDVTGNENIKHLHILIEKLDGMDVFVYNSGTADVHKQLNEQNEMNTTKTNVLGFVELTAHAFNYFVKQGYGQIAATSSVAGNRGNGWVPSYSASKAYMSNYMEALLIKAQRMKKNISVIDIQPGFVDTVMAKGDGLFWVAPVEKAAKQMFAAIEKRKRKAYITKRWFLFAWLMGNVPFFIYRKMG
jgi:short-subunit dehydrogenase